MPQPCSICGAPDSVVNGICYNINSVPCNERAEQAKAEASAGYNRTHARCHATIDRLRAEVDSVRAEGRREGMEEAARIADKWGWSDKPDHAHGIRDAIRRAMEDEAK